MKGRICFIVVSVILAVTIGYSSDISAYNYSTDVLREQRVETQADRQVVSEITQSSMEMNRQTDGYTVQQAENDIHYATNDVDYSKETTAASTPVVAGYDLSEYDIQVLRQIVMAESGTTEDEIGQIMVANVVLNRLRSGYGNSVEEVVFAEGQFEPTQNGTYWDYIPTESVINAVDRAVAGEDYSGGALYFVSCNVDYSWFAENLTYVTGYGGHLFFK